MCRYVHCTDPEIHTDTYLYIQYLQIHIIPTHTVIPTYTYNTYIYMQYLDILTYLHIPKIPTDTYIYLRITVYTYMVRSQLGKTTASVSSYWAL